MDRGRTDKTNECAVIYWAKNYKDGSGYDYKYLKNGDTFNGSNWTDLGQGWGDKISSIRVKQGCTLAVWWDNDEKGAHLDITSDIAWLKTIPGPDGKNWDDEISSYRCYCS